MCAGVGKSGSPAAKLITGRPAACRAFALPSTLSVADSAMEPILVEIRLMSCATLRAYGAVVLRHSATARALERGWLYRAVAVT